MQQSIEMARQIHGDRAFYVEARVGSSNHRNYGNNSPCRATWDGARHNEPADDVIRALAKQVTTDHPADDGEPVTPAWFDEMGWRRLGDTTLFGGPPWPNYAHPTDRIYWRCIGQTGGGGSTPEPMYSLRFGRETLTCDATRGHVRRLCAALGVPLRAGSKEGT